MVEATPHRDENADHDFDRLITEAREGSSDALGELLTLCRSYLLGIANREMDAGVAAKVGASDIVQETLLEAQNGIKNFEGQNEAELLAWLRSILKHNLTDVFRRYVQTEKRHVGREQRLASGFQLGQTARDGTPSKIVRVEEEEHQLHDAIEKLPSDYRRVIELRNWDLLPFATIGEKMQRTEEAARKLWVRAIERLQKEMKPTNDDERT